MIVWSYTKLADYVQCPFKFREKHITKKAKSKETEAMRQGKETHKHLENAVTDGTELPDYLAHMANTATRIRNLGGVAELKLGVRQDWTPCDFFAADVWGRGVIDVLMADAHGRGIIIDWKGGKVENKKYQKNDEVRLHATLAKAHFPELRSVAASYCFTRDGSWTQSTCVFEFGPEQQKVNELMQRIEDAAAKDRFTTRKNNLCPWCEVAYCKHCKPREK